VGAATVEFTAEANAFANALALSTFANHKRGKMIAALEAVRLVANGNTVKVESNILDHALTVFVQAAVKEGGEVAVSGERLAALAAGFPPKAEITVQVEGTDARVASGRSRFRIPAMPIDELPAVRKIIEATGGITLAREQVLALLARPMFAAETEKTRYYLCGICLHSTDDGLCSVATDGRRLARVTLAGTTGLSSDRRLIVPHSAVKIITRLLADNGNERITLTRSPTLFSVEATGFQFISKIIDSTYPAYEQLIPAASDNFAITDRVGLVQALERIGAAIDPALDAMRLVGLRWRAGEPQLHLCVPGHADAADDILDAKVGGSGQIAVQIRHLAEIAAELDGERIHLDTKDHLGPLLVTDPTDPKILMLQMPCAWPREVSAVA
jgi:DNA polymerase-3 subunit beta